MDDGRRIIVSQILKTAQRGLV